MQIKYDGKVPLGQGGFGSVFPGTFNGRQVAVKRVALYQVNDNEEKTLQQLNHPNVIKLLHSESNDEFKYFAMELCAASLDQLFLKSDHDRKYKGPALPPHLVVFLQLASGLEYIHSTKLIHRDIKPENVLISVDPAKLVTIKWADFGLSKFVNERGTFTLSGIKGTTNYFAPELLKKIKNSEEELGRGDIKSDVFAFALVIGYLLLNGQHVYGSNIDIPTNILKKNQVNMDKIDPSHNVRDLLTKMLKDEPGERISSEEVVKELQTIKIKILKKEEEFRELCKKKVLDLNEIKLLIKNGIDVNGKSNNGNNALHFLCFYYSSEKIVDAMRVLIQNGIDVNAKNNNGENALYSLCRWNCGKKIVEAMQFLIQNGIDVNEKNNDGMNALHWLCCFDLTEENVDAIRFLIQNGIDVNEKDDKGSNALHFLCCRNSIEKLIDAIKLLIQNGIDVNAKENNGRNALHLLCQFNSNENLIDAMEFLVQNGIDVNEKRNDGWNALHFLCQFHSSDKLIDAIQYLMAHRIQSNGIDARTLLSQNRRYKYKTETIEKIVQLLDRTAIGN